ncbi:hypothetical protein EG329_013014 [Mollisiaceae sp. DMI_Dod_QoI]|nr:hypothetical protein EG329_013014 [Helotiales sp. DMI_Dod_QoI]
MPTYNALGFSVRLHIWDPQQKPSEIDEKLLPGDPSLGHVLEEVSEEYFKGCHGVDFLGQSSSPFFLINAGRDLFFRKPQSLDGCKDVMPRHVKEELSFTTNDITSPATPFGSRPKSVADPNQTDGAEDGSESPLSSVPTNFDSSPAEIILGPENDLTMLHRSDGAPRGWLHRPSKPVTAKNVISKPLQISIPIKIQAEFSQRSFLRSINTNEQQDICISIFYNGEFVYSRSYRANTMRASTAIEKQPNFSGRRVGRQHEVPFIVVPLAKAPDKSAQIGVITNVETQWNKINELLLAEADEWGRAGKYDMFRSPIGEYLEDLSKLVMPEDMTKSRESGRSIGIIDVVIALGRTVVVGGGPHLKQPERKLPSNYCGPKQTLFFVPEELRRGQRSRRVEDIKDKEAEKDNGNGRPLSHSSTSELQTINRISTTKDTLRSSAERDDEYHIETIMKPVTYGLRKQSSTTSTQSLPLNMPPPSVSRRPLRPLASSSSLVRRKGRSNSLTSMTSGHDPILQDMPGDPSRKRFRGGSPVADRSAKRQKGSTLYVEIPAQLRFPSATVAGSTDGPQVIEKNQRPVRRRVKTTHFDEMSPTPTGSSSKLRDSKPPQTPTPTADADNSHSNRRRSSGLASSTPKVPEYPGTNTYKSKMFGMDGTSEEPFDFGFGFDGSGSRPNRSPRNTAARSSRIREQMLDENQQGDLDFIEAERHDEFNSQPSLLTSERKTRRSGRNIVSTGELKGLLDSHKPTDAVDNTFGSSFTNSSANRPMRSANKKDKKAAVSKKSEVKETRSNRLQASIQRSKLFVVKGLVAQDWENLHKLVAKSTSKPKDIPKTAGLKGAVEDEYQVLNRLPTGPSLMAAREQKNLEKTLTKASLNAASTKSELSQVMRRQRSAPQQSGTAARSYTSEPQTGSTASWDKPIGDATYQAEDREATQDETMLASTIVSNKSDRVRQTRSTVHKASGEAPSKSPTNVEGEKDSSGKQQVTAKTPTLQFPLSGLAGAMLETPSMPGHPSTSENNLNGTWSGNTKSDLATSRAKPNLSIQTGIANALTTRSYTHTPEGRKAPTPRSDSFPTVKKTPTPANDTFFIRTFEPPMRTRSSSNVEMLPPASTPSLVTSTPEESGEKSISGRPHPSPLMSSPTPTTNPPPSIIAKIDKAAPAVDRFSSQNTTIKNRETTPPILQPPKSYSTRMSAEVSRQSRTQERNKNVPNHNGGSQYTKQAQHLGSAQQPSIPTPAPETSPLRRLHTTRSVSSLASRPARVDTSGPLWKPVDVCTNSVLGYATKEQVERWFRLEYDSASENVTRQTRQEAEGVFRAHSILMGVRYVFGADFEDCQEGGEEGSKGGEIDVGGED